VSTAKNAHKSLSDALQGDGALLKDLADIGAFGVAVLAGGPLTLAAYLILITKTAGASLSAATRILGRLTPGSSARESRIPLANLERFQSLFYTTCQRHYFEALAKNKTLQKVSANAKSKDTLDLSKIAKQLTEKFSQIEDAEIVFYYSIDPTSREIPLYRAYAGWLNTALSVGVEDSLRSQIVREVDSDARKRLQVSIASPDPTHQWMRNYLALSAMTEVEESTKALDSVMETLKGWQEGLKKEQKKSSARWTTYKAMLQALPNQKDSMYNEDFGVSEVFVAPGIHYHRAGQDAKNKEELVPSVGRLLGALVSNRIEGSDLIILCGGPGSGKSTLCRVLASKLASDPQMHPVFLRLRRCKEGADISAFIEESLIHEGTIAKLSDLKDIPNVVLILDGFDELVLASRTKLRHFFNLLLEDIRTGPLRNARVLVSGRDTLFPRGEGLPRGSHVVGIRPFDRTRVAFWGARWRARHVGTSPGHTFHPEKLLERQETPLQQLATWPLTLHLLAKVHTAGLIDLGSALVDQVEKAYLYRSILKETAKRQVDQTSGHGRLAPKEMRQFLRALAWSMYSRTQDSLSVEDVGPIARRIFPGADEAALADLTEVAIVNAPEIQRGEETGFEFVHKSFSEYLVAEHIALVIEGIIHRVPDINGNEAWREGLVEAARSISEVLAIRVIPAEVQEMLEPMLGSFVTFSKGEKVDELVSKSSQEDGLRRVKQRFQEIFDQVLKGNSQLDIEEATRGVSTDVGRLDGYSNYLIGVVLIGAAASRRSSESAFDLEPWNGCFWRWLMLIHAGGTVHRELASRLYRGTRLGSQPGLGDNELPLRLGWLPQISNYSPNFRAILTRHCDAVKRLCELAGAMSVVLNRLLVTSNIEMVGSGRTDHFVSHVVENMRRLQQNMWQEFGDSGLLANDSIERLSSERESPFPGLNLLSFDEAEDIYRKVASLLCSNDAKLHSEALSGLKKKTNVTVPETERTRPTRAITTNRPSQSPRSRAGKD
jgi:energy-coupling factor transporter ATP-binding protein EcfA2